MPKNHVAVILMSVLSLSVASCGQDAEDGKAFLSFSWTYAPTNYTDNNPAVPATITQGTNYQTSAGVYTYSYQCSSYYWYGTYEIEVDEGVDGFLIVPGVDGADRYFNIYLGCNTGPTLTERAVSVKAAEEEQAMREGAVRSDQITKSEPRTFSPITDATVVEQTQGRYTIRLKYQQGY